MLIIKNTGETEKYKEMSNKLFQLSLHQKSSSFIHLMSIPWVSAYYVLGTRDQQGIQQSPCYRGAYVPVEGWDDK